MSSPAGEENEPRVLVALGDRWTCVLLCAELRERGYVATCVARLSAELLLSEPDAPVRVAVADGETLRERDSATLLWFRATGDGPACLLLLAADAETIAGPWDESLRRPLTLGNLADAVERIAGVTVTPGQGEPPSRDILVRRGDDPWPAARCTRCGKSRHCDPPRNTQEGENVRVALVKFALEHEHPG
jgi:hypothetical protein